MTSITLLWEKNHWSSYFLLKHVLVPLQLYLQYIYYIWVIIDILKVTLIYIKVQSSV